MRGILYFLKEQISGVVREVREDMKNILNCWVDQI